MYLAALAITRSEPDAEDVGQDGHLNAFHALPAFRFESRFSTWLEQITVSEARTHPRRQRTHKSVPLNENDEDSEE